MRTFKFIIKEHILGWVTSVVEVEAESYKEAFSIIDNPCTNTPVIYKQTNIEQHDEMTRLLPEVTKNPTLNIYNLNCDIHSSQPLYNNGD